MTVDAVQVRAERRNGTCLLRISGELDLITVDALGERADAAVQEVPGPVFVDLSGLTFVDAHAARVLDSVMRTLPEGRPVLVGCCPRGIRRTFGLLGLSLNYSQTDCAADLRGKMPAATDRVPGVLRDARAARMEASARLAQLADTSIRLASTMERADLIREQGRQALAASRAARATRETSLAAGSSGQEFTPDTELSERSEQWRTVSPWTSRSPGTASTR